MKRLLYLLLVVPVLSALFIRLLVWRYTRPPVWYVPFRPLGYRGVALPPLAILIADEFKGDIDLLPHELAHWQQAERMGLVRFGLTYAAQRLRYGYWLSPLEVEARAQAEAQTGAKHPLEAA